MIDTRIVLVSGSELSGLMIDHGIGVTPLVTYNSEAHARILAWPRRITV